MLCVFYNNAKTIGRLSLLKVDSIAYAPPEQPACTPAHTSLIRPSYEIPNGAPHVNLEYGFKQQLESVHTTITNPKYH